MGTKTEALLADEAAITEIDELRPLITEGQERGFLTVEQIASSLEEVEVTKEQVAELHAYLLDQGIEVLSADGRKVAYKIDGDFFIADAKPGDGKSDEGGRKKLDLGHMRVRIEPTQEWATMFASAWRLQRDFQAFLN